jgi:mono/diheme cytochrome c family protein
MARRVAIAACVAAAALLAAGCGELNVQLSEDDPDYEGAVLFAQRCGMCHTLDVAGTQGSATNVSDRENVDGPNFNVRKEQAPDVLYAIANGGFSGAIMPENIVTGRQAEQVAAFVEKYSGQQTASGG